MPKKTILEVFQSGGVIVGDGSYIFTLERRGYVKAGPYTPEVVVQHPEAVRQLSREFARAGANVIQALTYSANESKLKSNPLSAKVSCELLNDMAIDIAKEVAAPVDAYVCGGISPTVSYKEGCEESAVMEEFRVMLEIFVEKGVDFLLGEFFGDVEEAVIAVKAMRKFGGGLPIALTLRAGPSGDFNDVPLQKCAVMLKQAGADIIGVNCGFDPDTTLKSIAMLREGLAEAGLSAYMMAQPCGFHCQEAVNLKKGFYNMPEYPFALEPRTLTRLDCYKYAREAFKAGVHYIGGCCGFEPHHVRAVAMELAQEVGRQPPGIEHADKWGEAMAIGYSGVTNVGEKYWTSLVPAAGRKEIKIFATANQERKKDPREED